MPLHPKSFVLTALSALVLAACAPSRSSTPAPTPTPVPTLPETLTTPTPEPTPSAAPVIAEAPRNWQLLDPAADRVPGISAERAERELLAGKQPRRTVIVAVLDGGVDTAHADLKANLWANPKERPGNGKDDDGNGYVDDVRGWNFIGGRDGRNVEYDTYELTREYVRCTGGAQGASQKAPSGGSSGGSSAASSGGAAGRKADSLPAGERERCERVTQDFEKKRAEATQLAQQVRMVEGALGRVKQVLGQALGTDSLTPERVMALQPTGPEVQQARQVYLQLAANGITPAAVAQAKEQTASQLEYGLNASYNPRPIVGDDYANMTQRRYGNADVMGPDAEHGTHVAGIIAAVRGNNVGVDGVAPAVRIMGVRTVPNGDERDKDVANAIRYAVDNGAQIINMSFGKAYSPGKAVVDEAVKYADSRGVLMVHAAGNDGENVDSAPSFPIAPYKQGGRAQNWIEVGASSWKGGDSLVASFSNYGRGNVDVFAPGVDVLSTVPGGKYERNSGTSMAAPVVTGVAALLMAYYPALTAADVKRIILASVTSLGEQQVLRPGANGEKVPFSSLSATGGIVNVYNAVRMAEEGSGTKP